MRSKERQFRALEMRRAGLKLDQIGAELGGISGARVRQLVAEAERIEKSPELKPIPLVGLSAQLENILREHNACAPKDAANLARNWKSVRGLGRHGANEIIAAVYSFVCSDVVRRERARAGMTIEECADACGVPPRVWKRWETGVYHMPLKAWLDFTKAAGISDAPDSEGNLERM